MVQDESIFLRMGTNGRKLWSRVGDPVTASRHGRRDRTVVFGALAEDGTRLMRQYGRFDGPTFVRYLKEVRRRWGRVLLVTDNASQHKHREVRKYLEEHDWIGDPVPAYRDAEAQRSRVRMEGCKIQVCHFRTLRDA